VVFVLSESSTEGLATSEDTRVRLTLASPIKSGLNIAVNAGVLLAKWYFR
jgi:rRNA methylase